MTSPRASRLEALLAACSGQTMYDMAAELYPLCRSITGDGARATLARIAREVPLTIEEVPSGTPVFDWTVPPEWNIREAWIKGPDGSKVVDFADHSLHVVNYSEPVSATMSLEDLLPRLHTLPDRPDWIPYRTTYYDRAWGFCLTDRQLRELPEGQYEVYIDSDLAPGSLSYGECVLPGKTTDEILLSAHTCHPSLANDNLSGIAVLAAIGKALADVPRHYTYRLLFGPGTIGSITWLARNRERAQRIRHGLVISCVGDSGGPMYKRSRRGDADIDRAMAHVVGHFSDAARVEDFSPYGYDERQYCSPGFDLAVGLFERSMYGSFPEYHTSADNMDFIAPEHLEASCRMICETLDILETNRRPISRNPYCEPQLGRRGLYQAMGGDAHRAERQMAMLWVLNLADARHTLLDIAVRSGLPYARIREAAERLEEKGLLGTQACPDQTES